MRTGRVAILLDGGFVKKKLAKRLRRFPTDDDVIDLCRSEILRSPHLEGLELFRIYYYDAPPLDGTAENPLDGRVVNFSNHPQAHKNRSLIDGLEMARDFAVRRGQLMNAGWKLGSAALRNLKTTRPIEPQDLVPDISQKGVDMRIGLDIATLALKKIVDALVLVTGDSDFVPPMKFARKEGVRVYLETLDHQVRRELKAHADIVL